MSDDQRPRRILIAEDDARAAQTLSQLLREDGYDVEIALDGAAAVARLGRVPAPDVLLADYRLPHLDGLAVATYGRACLPHLPIVMITSYPEVIARGSQGPIASPFVMMSKPVEYAELAREIAAILAHV